MTQRNPIIDVCKGIGILLVVVGHVGTIWGTPIYMFHMSLFFILSGICFSDKYLNQKFEFVRKRFMSLMLPFIIFKAIAYAIIHFSPWQQGAADFIDQYHLLGTLWFLKCLFVASIIGLGFIWVLRKIGCNKRWVPALLAIVMASVVSLTVGDNKAVFAWFTFHFLIGYAVKPHLPTLSNTSTSVLKILAIGGVITLLLLFPSVTPDVIGDCTYVNYLPYCITAFGGSWLILQFSSFLVQKKIMADTLTIIGQNTMSIMLFHFVAFMVIDLVIESGIIVVKTDLFVKIAKINMGIVLPMILDIIYKNIKVKLKLKNV